jgi:CheY-like chemotaxis protein/nitrogen-specific signal transduction histidine kinase
MPALLKLPSPAQLRTAHASLETSLIEKGNAESSNAAKSQFLARMTHEIRTPLSSIVGYTQILLNAGGHSPETKKRLEIIQKSSGALMNIVDDVLDFSAIETGHLKLKESVFDLQLLCDDTISMLLPVASNKGLILTQRGQSPPPRLVVGDENRIRQIILNLLNNAIKFTSRGYVELDISYEDSTTDIENICLSVRDTGIGIAPDQLHSLFQPFHQIDGSFTRQFGGVGLGLSICKRIVDTMRGSIGYRANDGGGSTFWVRLSLPKAKPSKTTSLDAPPTESLGARILLVDDVLVNRDLAQTILEIDGYEVDLASDGVEAVKMFNSRPYDLILMDIQMPVMDGISATLRIRESGAAGKAIPIIAMTANIVPEQVKKYFQAGMNDFVGKPYTRQRLIDAVKRWSAGTAPLADRPG